MKKVYAFYAAAFVSALFLVYDLWASFQPNESYRWLDVVAVLIWTYNVVMFVRFAQNERAYVRVKARVDSMLNDLYAERFPEKSEN